MTAHTKRIIKIVKNASYMFLLQLSNFVVPFYIFSIISSTYGTETLGKYFFFITYAYFTTSISDFGLTITSLSRLKKVTQKHLYIKSVFCIKSILIFASYVFLPFLLIAGDFSFLSIFLIGLSVLFQSLNPVWYFQYHEKMLVISISGIIGKVINIFIILIFLTPERELDFFILAYLLGMGTTFLINTLYLLNKEWGLLQIKIKQRYVKAMMKVSFETFKSRLALIIYTSFNTLLIGATSGMQQVASYGMAEKIYQAGQGVVTPVSQVLYPFMANKPNLKVFKMITISFISIYAIGCMIIAINAKLILNLLFSNVPNEAVYLLYIFLLTSIVNCMSVFMGYPAFALYSNISIPNRTVIVGALTYIVLLPLVLYASNFVLSSYIWTLLAVEVFVLSLRSYHFIRLTRSH